MNSKRHDTSAYDSEYHQRQFAAPYQSTILFFDWLDQFGVLNGMGHRICDLGCGKGANLYYAANRFRGCDFVGVDIDDDLVREGNEIIGRASIANCRLVQGDIHDVHSVFGKEQFDGVISLQTLSWLPGYERAFDAIAALAPNWIAVTSLFYDGPIDAKIVISDFDAASAGEVRRSFFYNTYSIPKVRTYLANKGFKRFEYMKFEIPIDLPRNETGRMGTYTERTSDGRRLQISGPLLMNWYFIFAGRE